MADRIQMTASGSTKNLEQYLKMAGKTNDIRARVMKVAETGLAKLIEATPKDSSQTANSWSVQVVESGDGLSIEYHNSNINQGLNVAVLIRYGHGTRNGGYVPANDFITPAIKPIFDQVSTDAWKAVTSNG